MKIKKYLNDIKADNLTNKLLSYSALAAAFIATSPDVNAQCTGETATAGNPVGIDIDGDGTIDVNLNVINTVSSFFGSFTTSVGTIPVGTFPVASAMATASIPQSTAPGFAYYGCYLFSLGAGAFAGPTSLVIGPATAVATATASAMISYTNAFNVNYYTINYSFNYCLASAAGANQIVGLSASGSAVCGLIDSAPGVSGGGTSALVGYGIMASYDVASLLAGGIRYDFPSSSITAMATATFPISGITCTTSTASVFGGYFVAGPQGTLSTVATTAIAPIPDSTYAGPYLLSGPNYTNVDLGTVAGGNLVTHLAVQFESGGETLNGWISVTCTPDGTITCTGSGYQQCSLETAAATSGNAADGCMTVGAATNENPACMDEPPVTDIPTLSEWGLITLMLLLMSYGSIAMSAVGRLAGVTTRNVPLPGKKMFSLPFDNSVYRKALLITGLLVAGGFAASIATIGTVLMSDIIGSMIAGPVFAYLAHLLYLLETNRKKK